MTSVSVADFFGDWLREQIDRAQREAQENGSSRAAAWELRTLNRAHAQFAGYLDGALAEDD
jgi:hypothetical protein